MQLILLLCSDYGKKQCCDISGIQACFSLNSLNIISVYLSTKVCLFNFIYKTRITRINLNSDYESSSKGNNYVPSQIIHFLKDSRFEKMEYSRLFLFHLLLFPSETKTTFLHDGTFPPSFHVSRHSITVCYKLLQRSVSD